MRRLGVLILLGVTLAGCGRSGHRIGALPPQFVAVEAGASGPSPRLTLYRLSGERLVSLAGWTVAGDDELRSPDHKLYRLKRSGLVRVAKITTPTTDYCVGATCVTPADSSDEPAIMLRGKRVVGAPHAQHPVTGWGGHWVRAQLSPDRNTILATWSNECESPAAYLVDVSSGRLVAPGAKRAAPRESMAVGWSRGGEAIVMFTTGACGTAVDTPGVYGVRADGSHARLITPVTATSTAAYLVTVK